MEDISTLCLRGKRVLFKRRRSERSACQKNLFGELVLPECHEIVETRVLDLSEKGIGCTVPKKIVEKTRAYIHLKKSETASTCVVILLSIDHCAADGNGDCRVG